MPQIFDVIANENMRYKRNELEYIVSHRDTIHKFKILFSVTIFDNYQLDCIKYIHENAFPSFIEKKFSCLIMHIK